MESRSSADNNLSSSNESSATSEDGNGSSSSSSSSSSTSYSGVEVLLQKEGCSWQGHKAANHRYQAKCEEAVHGEDVRAEEVGGATCTHTYTHTSQTDTSPTPYTSSLSLSFPCSSMVH